MLAHEAPRDGVHPTLSVWSAPAIGLQTPSRLATLTCDRAIRGGASAVGFAGGHGAPFVWVAERAKAGAAVLAYDWRARSKPGGGGASIAWVPGGAGRRLACVTADGGGRDLAACGGSFLSFLSLTHTAHAAADGRPHGAPKEGDHDRAWYWSARERSATAELHDAGGRVIPTWEPAKPWDDNTAVPATYAFGQQDTRHGFRFGGGFEDDADATRARQAMPAPTGEARLEGDDDGTCHVTVRKASFAPHGEPGALRPLQCLGFEPVASGPDAHVLTGTSDGCVLRLGRGRRVCASWQAHQGGVVAVCFAGGGTTYAATAGTDGLMRLWALTQGIGPPAVDGWACALSTHTLIGEWDMRAAGLVAEHGPRVLLAAPPSRYDPSEIELLLFCGHGLHSVCVHGNQRQGALPPAGQATDGEDANVGVLKLADGRLADEHPRCLLQGHRRAPHLILAHPHSQHVLTIDEHAACVWHLDGDSSTAAGAPSTARRQRDNPVPAVPAVTVTMPAAEGRPCCAAFSPSGERWAVGLASGRVLLVDVDYDGGAATAESSTRFAGRSDVGVQRTLLDLPMHAPPPLPHGAPAYGTSTAIVAMSFNPEEELLATASGGGLLGVYELPRTLSQQRRRRHLLEMRSNVPRPVQFGVPGEEPMQLRIGGCHVPPSAARVSALLWSVSSAHLFAISPAGTAVASALRGDFILYPVVDESVGGAEWPKDLEGETTHASSLCDGGEMLAARFVPMSNGQKLPRGAPLAPPAGRALLEHRARPLRLSKSARPRSVHEKLRAARTGGGVAAVNGQLGRLDVHAGLQWSARAHEQNAPQPTGWAADDDAASTASFSERTPRTALKPAKSVVAHVAWTVGERFAITGDSEQPCLCIWERNRQV